VNFFPTGIASPCIEGQEPASQGEAVLTGQRGATQAASEGIWRQCVMRRFDKLSGRKQ